MQFVKEAATPKLLLPPASAEKEVGARGGVHLEHLAGSAVTNSTGEQVVGREPVDLGHQRAEAAAERVAGDPRGRDDAARDGQAVLARRRR